MLLADRYRLVRPLARGGMGAVWIAEHLALSSEVAVKIIDPRTAHRELGVPRFLREARALAALRSPHIVQVLDFGSDGEVVYLVMELLEGRTLGQRLKVEGKLSAAETNRILCQVCKAMSHAHERGIVHRDLKPDNIFLCDQSREHVTKVVDFGIAKSVAELGACDTGTEAGTLLGTPSYMSPEQCRGASRIDHRSDLWAIGAIAYECLLGKRLFESQGIGDLLVRICTEALPVSNPQELPAGFDAWLQRAMARSPEERFPSASELAQALSQVLEVAAASTRRVDSAETLQTEREPTLPPASAPAVGSTLENGSLEQAAGHPQRNKRSALRLVAGSAGSIALLALVAFVRSGASTAPPTPAAAQHPAVPAAPASAAIPSGSVEAAASAAGAPRPSGDASATSSGAQREAGQESAPDRGRVAAEAPRGSVRQPVLGKGPAARVAPRRAPAHASGVSTPLQAEPEVDALRKKR